MQNISRRLFLHGTAALSAALAFPHMGRAQTSATVAAIKERGTLRVGWATFYPLVFKDPRTNTVSGVLPDMLALISKRMGVKVELVEDNVATLIAGLQSQKFDVTSLLGITEQRQQAATFTKPIMKDGTTLIGLKSLVKTHADGWKSYNTPDTRVSVTLGSNTDTYVTKMFDKAQIVRVRSDIEGIASILSKQCDVKAIGLGSVELVTEQNPQLMAVPQAIFFSYPLAFCVKKNDTDFAAWLDDAVTELRSSGKLLEIVRKWKLSDEALAL